MSVLQRLGERFWFVPAVLCLAAFVLAESLIAADESLGDLVVPTWVDVVLYRVGESGSRDILGAIASSSLAVAGTTFSITMAVLALTSSSYGPRLVRNFMADRGNQVVLGVYVATFLYSLLVLRSIRVIGDPGDQDGEVFVPHLAVNGAVLLAVANVGVLIYFIHHISDSIQIATLASGVRGDLNRTVDRLYPEVIGRSTRSDDPHLPQDLQRSASSIAARRPGYLQFVRDDALMKAAVEHDVLLALQVRPGQYVLPDTTVVLVHPGDRASEKLEKRIRSALAITDARSPFQDVDFAVQQLTEMAVRALSPGTNDPYTAVNALDDLSVGLASLAARPTPSPFRFDGDGALRVHAIGPDVEALVTTVLDTLRWYASSAPLVMHHGLELIQRIGTRSTNPDVDAVLVTHIALLREGFAAAGNNTHDVRVFEDHADQVLQVLHSIRAPKAHR